VVSVKIDLDAVMRQAERLGAALANPRALMAALADWLFKVTRESFQKQASPEGQSWQALSPNYAARKARLRPGRNILQFTGTLQRPGVGLLTGFTERVAWVESRLPYGAVHQYGGRAGRRLAALIPARPYLPGVAFAEAEGARIADEHLQDAIDGRSA
jgi:phage virion morphogenesis protein